MKHKLQLIHTSLFYFRFKAKRFFFIALFLIINYPVLSLQAQIPLTPEQRTKIDKDINEFLDMDKMSDALQAFKVDFIKALKRTKITSDEKIIALFNLYKGDLGLSRDLKNLDEVFDFMNDNDDWFNDIFKLK